MKDQLCFLVSIVVLSVQLVYGDITKCYLCDSSDPSAQQSYVHDPSHCHSETVCQSDELCEVSLLSSAGERRYRYSCANKRLCTLLTQEALKRKDECTSNPDPFVCGVGKRAVTVCTACCGYELCNNGTCTGVIDRLYVLWKSGVLDFNTLKTTSSSAVVG